MSSTKPHHEAETDSIEQHEGSYFFYPRSLNIIWGLDNRYWKLPKTRKGEPAELVQVSWLEITGLTNSDVPAGTYEISFTISMKQGNFGWGSCPLFMMAKVGKKGRYFWKQIKLPRQQMTGRFEIPTDDNKFHVVVPTDNVGDASDPRIYFGLYEVWTGKWKGGLLIHSAKVQKKLI